MKNEKKFLIPEAEIVVLSAEDIITSSGEIAGEYDHMGEDDVP